MNILKILFRKKGPNRQVRGLNIGIVRILFIILITFTVLALLYRLPLVRKSLSEANSFWSMLTAISTTGAFIAALLAVRYASQTWNLERLPIVHAVGTFIISKGVSTNELRDKTILVPDSSHTFHLINVGKGPAMNVVPSVKKEVRGYFLEDINPHTFSLPSNKGTKELNEILRVHGQRFVQGDDYELEFSVDRSVGYFYISFEGPDRIKYVTRVTIRKVGQADGEHSSLANTPGIELWKVVNNAQVNI